MGARARGVGLFPGLVLLGSLGVFLWWIARFDSPKQWLLLVHLRIWLWTAIFFASSLSVGLRLLSLLLPEPPRLGERWVFALTLGVVVFFLGVFVGGLLSLLGSVFFFSWPALMLAYGGRAALSELRRTVRHLRRLGWALVWPRGPIEAGAALLLALGLVGVYLQVATPTNLASDAVWYHLSIAEHYAAGGRIRAFGEGWFQGVLPQLASVLYTWAFLAPQGLFEHIALSKHIELLLFLATLAGISIVARRLTGRRVPLACALIFAFPGFLVYDANLNAGADHVLAFWSPALVLALLRLSRHFHWREAVLSGAVMGGALLTKYHAFMYLIPAAPIVAALAWRARRLWPAAVWAVTSLVVFSPHWLKNWVFYGDPLYPFLHKHLAGHPLHPGSVELAMASMFHPEFSLQGTPARKVVETLKAMVTFAFVKHEWGFHDKRPIFGALFTCLLVALPFVRARARLWLLIAAIHVGIAAWFATSHQDRYLQALLPAMVAASAALLVLVWDRGVVARMGAGALLVVQLAYGSDVYFIRVHNMIGDTPIKAFADFVTAHRGEPLATRLPVWGDLDKNDVQDKVPRGGKLLAHHPTEKLGARVESAIDSPGWQGAIEYMSLSSPAAVLREWKRIGVTHVWWQPVSNNIWLDQMVREAIFHRAVAAYVRSTEMTGRYRFGALETSSHPPDVDSPTRIGWIGCNGDPPNGVYEPRPLSTALHVPVMPQTAWASPALVDQVLDVNPATAPHVVVLRDGCPGAPELRQAFGSRFSIAAVFGERTVFAAIPRAPTQP